MTLHEFMTLENISRPAMAKKIGVSEEGLKKWLRGARTPRPEQLRRIYKVTGKRVEPNDFIL